MAASFRTPLTGFVSRRAGGPSAAPGATERPPRASVHVREPTYRAEWQAAHPSAMHDEPTMKSIEPFYTASEPGRYRYNKHTSLCRLTTRRTWTRVRRLRLAHMAASRFALGPGRATIRAGATADSLYSHRRTRVQAMAPQNRSGKAFLCWANWTSVTRSQWSRISLEVCVYRPVSIEELREMSNLVKTNEEYKRNVALGDVVSGIG
jgi:hypothetical protein